jgi:gluconolactonase
VKHCIASSLLLASLVASAGAAPPRPNLPARTPNAIADLNTSAGLAIVSGEWRAHDGQIVPVQHRLPGADLKPTGEPVTTFEIQPKAFAKDYDCSTWNALEPGTIDQRRSIGRLSFEWYRLEVTIPDVIGGFGVAHSTVVLEVVVDDYAEVWVNGELSLSPGDSGGGAVAGYNAPNRVVLTRDAVPGETYTITILGANGPMSDAPGNYVWIRSATLDFYEASRFSTAESVPVSITRADPAMDAIVAPGAIAERIAEGFTFTEGPVWRGDALLFSDPNQNVIHRWSPGTGLSIFRTKSGYTGVDIGAYGQPGSNGLAIDPEGRLIICEHGNRRVTRLEHNGQLTVLADRFEGKRLNSPNDVTCRSDGAIFFTDPPFGLPGLHDDPRRESPYTGVYSLKDGVLRMICNDMSGPNGIALSPDERHLYVANWDTSRKVVMRFDVTSDATLSNPVVFADLTDARGEEALDGLKVDGAGHVYVSGPGGIWVFAPSGAHLGSIALLELPANFAFGDADKRTLYCTARTGLYRLRLGVNGK